MLKEKQKQEAKQRYMSQINDELDRKNEAEQKIKDLEKKENELIELLQKTNKLELLAMEDLKKILNGDSPEFFDDLVIEEDVEAENA